MPDQSELSADVVSLLAEWEKLALKATGRHSAACDHYETRDTFFGLASTALAAVVGSAVFVTLQHTAGPGYRIAFGVVGVLAAILSGIQTTAKYGQRAERHRQASRQYATVARRIDELHALPPAPADLQTQLDGLRKVLDDTGALAPNVPPKIWDAALGTQSRSLWRPQSTGESPAHDSASGSEADE